MFQSLKWSLIKNKEQKSTIPLHHILDHNVGLYIKSFLNKSDVPQLDILSKEICKNEYRHHLLQHCIYHILKLSDISSQYYHYQKIKKQLTDLHLIDYFVYMVSKMKWLYKLVSEYDDTQVHRLFLNDIPPSKGKSIYQLELAHQAISKFQSHLSTLVSKRKIILLNMYAIHFPAEFNKQYKVNCIQPKTIYSNKNQSFLLNVINCYISEQCIPRQYLLSLLFSDNIMSISQYIHLPYNKTYITLLEQNITLMNSHFEKLILKQFFDKLRS